MKNILLVISLALTTTGCLSRADSTNELDKRGGFSPQIGANAVENAQELRSVNADKRSPINPLRTEAWIEPVYIYDTEFDNGMIMEGTWAHIEVEPSRWVRGQKEKKPKQ